MDDVTEPPAPRPATDEERRLLDLALLTIKICLANAVLMALFIVVVVGLYPGMFAEPRAPDAVSVLQVAGAVGILAIVGFVIVGVVNARHGVVLPWLLRGGRMP
jgi:hypothetical protein